MCVYKACVKIVCLRDIYTCMKSNKTTAKTFATKWCKIHSWCNSCNQIWKFNTTVYAVPPAFTCYQCDYMGRHASRLSSDVRQFHFPDELTELCKDSCNWLHSYVRLPYIINAPTMHLPTDNRQTAKLRGSDITASLVVKLCMNKQWMMNPVPTKHSNRQARLHRVAAMRIMPVWLNLLCIIAEQDYTIATWWESCPAAPWPDRSIDLLRPDILLTYFAAIKCN